MGKILCALPFVAACLFTVTPLSAKNIDKDHFERNPNCVTFQGGALNFGATYKDPKTQDDLESVVILQGKDPEVYHKTNEHGLLRKFCEREIIDHLGQDRATEVLRLSD